MTIMIFCGLVVIVFAALQVNSIVNYKDRSFREHLGAALLNFAIAFGIACLIFFLFNFPTLAAKAYALVSTTWDRPSCLWLIFFFIIALGSLGYILLQDVDDVDIELVDIFLFVLIVTLAGGLGSALLALIAEGILTALGI